MTTVTIPNRTIPIAGTQPPSVEWYRWMSDITRRVGGVTTALEQTSGAVSVAGTLAVTGAATVTGRLGVGRTATTYAAEVVGAMVTYSGLTAVSFLSPSDGTAGASGTIANVPFILYTNNTPVGRLDTSGNLLIGGTTSAYTAANRKTVEVNGTTDAVIGLTVGGAATGYVQATATGVVLGTSSAIPVYLAPNSTARVTVESDGRLHGTALHNNAGSVTGTTNQYIASGTYTPTGTAGTNVSAVTPRACQWIRVGNVVTVSGACSVDPNTAGSTSDFALTLPIASALANAYQLGGAAQGAGTNEGWAVSADTTNDRANFESGAAGTTAAHEVTFSFTYVVL